MRLAEALEQSATTTLRHVADAHGLPHDDGTTRAELIERVAERLGSRAYLDEQLTHLSPAERDILSSAKSSAGELRGLLVDAEHPGAAEDLAERGWLYRVFAAVGPLRGEVFVVPDELLELLPEPTTGRTLEIEPEPPAELRWTEPAFSLFALTSALTRGGGGHLEQELRPWSQEPGGWAWEARWTFLQHLATNAGLLVHRADGALSPAPSLPRLLDEPSALADRLWHAYSRERGWSELQHAAIDGIDNDDVDLVDSVALRRAFADVLEQLPEGAWLRLSTLSRWLQRVHPRVVREQLTPRGLVLLQSAGWPELEQALLRYFFLGPLYWLGLIAASRDGELISRRRRLPSAREAEACRWEEPADLLAPASAQLGALLRAERYLVLRQRERVSHYHLVQSHVATALTGGGSIAECRQLLGQLTQAALPTSIEERLAAWDRRFGALDIRPAVLLQGRSAAELDEALSDEAVRPFLRTRLSPEVAEVAAADALELAAALRAADHLPRVDAALRLAAEPRRAYAGLVDEQVLEFLLVSLLAFQSAWPERLAELEGSSSLLERLAHQFPPARLNELRNAAERLAGALSSAPAAPRRKARRPVRRRRTAKL
jgi:hypothetical protein